MYCKNCGNKNNFWVIVTDYRPLELWEFENGILSRYCQKDTGDVQTKIECAMCGSDDVVREGFDFSMYSERPLVILPEAEWEEKISKYKRREEFEEVEEEIEDENEKEEKGEEENREKTEDKKDEKEQG